MDLVREAGGRVVEGTADLGNLVAIIEHKNLIGVQFHPEKSQMAGLNIFEILLKRI